MGLLRPKDDIHIPVLEKMQKVSRRHWSSFRPVGNLDLFLPCLCQQLREQLV